MNWSGPKEYANEEDWLIFKTFTCRFCGGTFGDRQLALKHARACDDNEDNHTCATCTHYEVGENYDSGYRHICNFDLSRKDIWMKHCQDWIMGKI